jgi:hypothetical protein
MNYLEHLLGENVWPLVGVLALGALALAIAIVATGRGRLLVGIVALAAIAGLLILVERLWVTDREQVDGIIDDIARSAAREDAPGIVRHLSPDCRYGGLNRDAIGSLAQSVFQQFEVQRVSVSSRRTEVFPLRREAVAEFMATVRARQTNLDLNPYPTRWILTFSETNAGVWQIEEIQQIPAFGDNRLPMTPPTGAAGLR